MARRERRRAERRKRKRRSAQRQSLAGGGESSNGGAAPGSVAPESFPDRMARRAEERNREAREALEPLRQNERPLVVTIGAALATLFAASIVIAYAVGLEVDGERPNVVGVSVPVLVIGMMAWGMWRARYWAVLGFQALLLIVLIVATLGLAAAETLLQVVGDVFLIALAGTLFWFMVKGLARIQMPDRLPRD